MHDGDAEGRTVELVGGLTVPVSRRRFAAVVERVRVARGVADAAGS